MFPAIASFLLIYFEKFHLNVTSLIIFLSCGICVGMITGIAVNLFPTNYRSMAASFILTFGRIGGAAGSFLVALLLENYCTSIFYISGGALISMTSIFIQLLLLSQLL